MGAMQCTFFFWFVESWLVPRLWDARTFMSTLLVLQQVVSALFHGHTVPVSRSNFICMKINYTIVSVLFYHWGIFGSYFLCGSVQKINFWIHHFPHFISHLKWRWIRYRGITTGCHCCFHTDLVWTAINSSSSALEWNINLLHLFEYHALVQTSK